MSIIATDTIAAVASGWQRSERAIIRLSGPHCNDVLRLRFHDTTLRAHDIAPARFKLTDDVDLPCLVMTYVGPESYTGEDAIEVLVPGNPMLMERIVGRLLACDGVREATPGEFSARAYMNGRLSIEQAEGIAARIAAQNDAQLAAADRLLSGEDGRRYRAFTEELATLLALVEAGIDFTDQEDVVPIAPDELARRLARIRDDIDALLGDRGARELADELPVAVLAGKPNAGKSSLFNALLARRRAVVSETAGTTRDRLEETLDLGPVHMGGGRIRLVDLAGIDHVFGGGDAQSAIDRAGVQRAEEAIRDADVVIYCDPSGRFRTALDARSDARVIRVRTKADLPLADDPGELGVCALDGWNINVLKRAIADASFGGAGERTPMLPRHRRALAVTAFAIDEAVGCVCGGWGVGGIKTSAGALDAPELVAGSMRAALDAIGEIVGEVSPDDVIGRVFATFCVGK